MFGSAFAVSVGLHSLLANPLRTILATLGIIIGVASLVAVLAVGDGVEQYARRQIEKESSLQTIVVAPRTTTELDGQRVPRAEYPRFGVAEAGAARALPGVVEVSLLATRPAAVRVPSGEPRGARLVETLEGTAEYLRFQFVAGRFISQAEAAAGPDAGVAVLSHPLADTLARGGSPEGLLGEWIEVLGRRYRVVGVLAPREGNTEPTLFVPLGAAGEDGPPPVLRLKAARVEEVPLVRQRAEAWLASRYEGWADSVEIFTRDRDVARLGEGILVFKLFMGAITGISLLVGGIGIMNVLLASVIERTREIGVRRAIGARRRDLLTQFLAESVTVAGAGSAIGVVLGMSGAYAVTAMMRARTDATVYAGFSWSTVAVAVLAAAATGLAFGLYPALRAARLSPIDAIRHE